METKIAVGFNSLQLCCKEFLKVIKMSMFSCEISGFFRPAITKNIHGALSLLLISVNLVSYNARPGITCKKIPCYMCDSACRWFIVKKAKIF